MYFHRYAFLAGVLALLASSIPAPAQPKRPDLAAGLKNLDHRSFPEGSKAASEAAQMLRNDVRLRLREMNQGESAAWEKIKSRAGWEKYARPRIEALQKSLGSFPPVPKDLRVRVTKKLSGAGYRILNLVFESRRGLLVTANLYLPFEKLKSMPGILICHSHHNPKTQGELQDMGMMWARAGCAVLVMDQVGHGERRQHPFPSKDSFAKPFRVSRQDYYFRYNAGLQLHLVGESLIGWMAWDLMRGVDLLRQLPNVDRDRIILLGAVAGGGDPASVTAALDERIACAVPFNFGGPQPETIFPLPKDAKVSFNYAGSGSWESTRNLRLSARDGFMPWVIVGSIAPRKLIYAHEFSWDEKRDPVWKRLQKIYRWYEVPGNLSEVHGRGRVTGRPPESTHCNNIGPVHRKQIHPSFVKWFDIPNPKEGFRDRKSTEELTCLTPALRKKGKMVWQLTRDLAQAQISSARAGNLKLSPEEMRTKMRKEWSRLLGADPSVAIKHDVLEKNDAKKIGSIRVGIYLLRTEENIKVPVLLLHPGKERRPVVVAVAQEGKSGFLKDRTKEIAGLLREGIAVCIPDLRGTGETSPGSSRGRRSAATSISATELMLGGTVHGGRCRDLLSVVAFLRSRSDVLAGKIGLWGDSFASVNKPEQDLKIPLGTSFSPHQAEPLGQQVVLLAGLFDSEISGIYVRGGFGSRLSLLESPFLYHPHDAIIPGATTSGDVADLAMALHPRPIWLKDQVDSFNRLLAKGEEEQCFSGVQDYYESHKAKGRFRVGGQEGLSVPGYFSEVLGLKN